jgi:hypothetical protein
MAPGGGVRSGDHDEDHDVELPALYQLRALQPVIFPAALADDHDDQTVAPRHSSGSRDQKYSVLIRALRLLLG